MCVLTSHDAGFLGASLNPNLQGGFIGAISPTSSPPIFALAWDRFDTLSIAYHSLRLLRVKPKVLVEKISLAKNNSTVAMNRRDRLKGIANPFFHENCKSIDLHSTLRLRPSSLEAISSRITWSNEYMAVT